MFRPSDRGGALFSLIWCGLAAYGVLRGWSTGQSTGQLLFGCGFAAIGVYLVAGRFVTDMLVRARTVYAVTERRMIIIRGLMERTVHAISLPGLAEIALTKGKTGRGTLTFDRAVVGTIAIGVLRLPSLAFEGIEDVAGVLKVIRDAQAARGATTLR